MIKNLLFIIWISIFSRLRKSMRNNLLERDYHHRKIIGEYK